MGISNVFIVTILKLKEAIEGDRKKFTRKFNEILESDQQLEKNNVSRYSVKN